jgi:hypothetical protein
MNASAIKTRPLAVHGQEPERGGSAPTRDRLAVERLQLDRLRPAALDVAAEILTALHDGLHGEVSAVASDRTPRYRRAQLLGSAGLPLEDLCDLWLQRPQVVATALAPLMEVPTAAKASLADVGGEVAVDAAAFTKDLLLALEEGSITVIEAERMDRDLSALHLAIAEARAAVAERAHPGIGGRRRP